MKNKQWFRPWVACFAMVMGLASPAWADDFSWFWVNSAHLLQDNNGFGWEYGYLNLGGVAHAMGCEDDRFDDLGTSGATVVIDSYVLEVPAGGFVPYGSGFRYDHDDGATHWWLVVTPVTNQKAITWSLYHYGSDEDFVDGSDGLDIAFTVSGQEGYESLPMQAVTPTSGTAEYDYVAGEIELACFGVTDVTANHYGNNYGWSQSYMNVRGRLLAAGCFGLGYLPFLSGDLAVDAGQFHVPVGGFERMGSGWANSFKYLIDDGVDHWEWAVTSSGMWWLSRWDTDLSILSAADGAEVTMSLGAQGGTTTVPLDPVAGSTALEAWTYDAPWGTVCGY